MSSLPDHIQAFLNPTIYPHMTDRIEMIQTHISWVFLAGEFAYKIKKPVDFGFLDFTTLAKRKYYFDRELQFNRRISPQIYLGLHTISRLDDGYAMDGQGEVVDYCLKMHRFAQRDLLDHRHKTDTFDANWMDQLAADTYKFHTAAKPDREIKHIALLQQHIELNLDAACRHADALNNETMKSLKRFADVELPELYPQLTQRQSAGHIRRCHGDLHLNNITLIDDRPQLFDCIEFSDDFSIIDTMSDVAFLIMDCDAHDRPDLGMRFLSRYLEFSGDYEGLTLLSLYLFYRATVRGKVACLLADELEGESRAAQIAEAARYFELALIYTRKQQSSLFAIGGLSGSGKSHLALLGCGAERAIIIRSDATRKRIASRDADLELYGKQMHLNTYSAMFEAATMARTAGFSVILDATFIHPDSRLKLKTVAEEQAVPLHFYWLDIEPSRLFERIDQRECSGRDISDADANVLTLQLHQYRRPDESWINVIDSSDQWPSRDEKKP